MKEFQRNRDYNNHKKNQIINSYFIFLNIVEGYQREILKKFIFKNHF